MDKTIVLNAHLRQYGDETWYEEDPDIKPIVINIKDFIIMNANYWSPNNPPTDIANPRLEKIVGWGKPAHLQWFEVPECPVELLDLEKNYFDIRSNPDKADVDGPEYFWRTLYSDTRKYKSSLEYIAKMQYHFRYGYWFFCNGKPTYIDGWHFRQLTTFRQGTFMARDKITGKSKKQSTPEYRDRARKAFIFYKWCLIDTTDHTGKDFGQRTCFGYSYPKNRRVGATSDFLSILYDIMGVPDTYSSMIGNAENTAKETFQQKFIKGWQRMPIWCRPMNDGTNVPKTKLINDRPGRRLSSRLLYKDYLESTVDYADKADRAYYDHAEISGAILLDEEGKTVATNILDGWGIVKPTMAPGGATQIRKFAYSGHPSTVEEMNSGGGENYMRLCNTSDYYESSSVTGQTTSGLRLLFISSPEGFEGKIGRYGESLIERLTFEQKKFISGKYGDVKDEKLTKEDRKSISSVKGARELIEYTLEKEKSKNTIEGDKEYTSFKRKNPIYYRDCWTIKGEDNGFNMEKLQSAIINLKLTDAPTRVGNLYWRINGEDLRAREYLLKYGNHDNVKSRGGIVVWKDEVNGRFYRSDNLSTNLQNIKVRRDHHFYCINTTHIASADTFDYLKEAQFKKTSNTTKMSKGSGAVLLRRDKNIDPDTKDVADWKTHKFVCDYVDRPKSSDEYCEEMLMMTVFYSCGMFPETNKSVLYQYYIDRGYGGFLIYQIDLKTGQKKDKPGFHSQTGSKQDLFDHARNYIEYHCHKEKHLRILEDFAAIKGMDDMTNRDMFVGATGCLLGSQHLDYYNVGTGGDKDESYSKDISDFF